MKKIIFLLAASLIAKTGISQELPQPSPFSKVEQTVGLTNIAVEYSRPSVKGRTIFGDLVPYGEVWRVGANKCTQFTASSDITFGGTEVKSGTYAMFAIPGKSGEWEVVLNSETEQWGAGDYDASKNVASAKVKANTSASFNETFTIAVNNVKNDGAELHIMWDKTAVAIPLGVNTQKIAMKNIEMAIKEGTDLDKVYNRAAGYYKNSLKDNKTAMDYIAKGLKVKETHNLYFMQAQILMDEGKKDEGLKMAKKALDLATKAESKGWMNYIEENITEWGKM